MFTSKLMQITFVHSPIVEYGQNYGTLFSPMWAYTLAAYVPSDWTIEITDCIFQDPKSIGEADVFAFSGINQDIDAIRKTYNVIRQIHPEAIYILGGPITWSMEQEGKLQSLEFFDHVFILDGEQTLPDFLNTVSEGRAGSADKIIRANRFAMDQALPLRFDLYRERAGSYYGGLIETSRGCPFLCEFCDIRVLPGNNRANNKNIELIVRELDEYFKLGITQFQFVCDNFIGDVSWARQTVDAIIEWKEKTGATISIFTWLTINLCNYPDLMEKMRRAGFSILFIGIESVNENSILETAKVQNKMNMESAVVAIQSFGFIIAPGFIFGFDSDTDTIFDDTIKFLDQAGVIGGDPSFLTALPGTPLMSRMKRTDRLIEADGATVREKISTNIKYLQDKDMLVEGFLNFIQEYTSANFQYSRYKNHINRIIESGNFLPSEDSGYGSPVEYLKQQICDKNNRRMLALRLLYLVYNPTRIWAVLKAWLLTKKMTRKGYKLDINFNYWVYVWTNIGLKYWKLKATDFKIESVDDGFDLNKLLEDSDEILESTIDTRKRGDVKSSQQARYTNQALTNLIEERASETSNDIN
ncbi:MAG: radical SAM protein [Rhodospirillaceae bacterium]|nr:radical SAM protein [Rhodospirillaceae bacterium]MBT7267697.1 radical SAM protein [Rhodospirillaceae bacterium]